MPTTVADLITARTVDELVEEQLEALAEEELPTTAWQPGSVPRTLLKADCTSIARLDTNVVELARAAFGETATGDWLTLWAWDKYRVARAPATHAEGYFRLTVASGSGPHAISAAALLVTNGTLRWRSTNTASVNVTSAGAVDIPVRAEATGDDYNIANDASLTVVSPALAGLSVSNPAYDGGSFWYTVAGADAESDASLLARSYARWAALGRGATLTAYEYHATTAPDAPTITRANAVPGGGNGTITVYIAQGTSVASGGQVSTVQTYVNTVKAETDTVTVAAASAVAIEVIGTVTFGSASYNTSEARAAIEAAVTAYLTGKAFGDTVDVGGVYHAIYGAAVGVVDVDLTKPAADTLLAASQIGAADSITLTYGP